MNKNSLKKILEGSTVDDKTKLVIDEIKKNNKIITKITTLVINSGAGY